MMRKCDVMQAAGRQLTVTLEPIRRNMTDDIGHRRAPKGGVETAPVFAKEMDSIVDWPFRHLRFHPRRALTPQAKGRATTEISLFQSPLGRIQGTTPLSLPPPALLRRKGLHEDETDEDDGGKEGGLAKGKMLEQKRGREERASPFRRRRRRRRRSISRGLLWNGRRFRRTLEISKAGYTFSRELCSPLGPFFTRGLSRKSSHSAPTRRGEAKWGRPMKMMEEWMEPRTR